ncbi:UNVERIFIED_CONTAM: hypothetical protein RMT77_004117 [Armadillidium vulgare]
MHDHRMYVIISQNERILEEKVLFTELVLLKLKTLLLFTLVTVASTKANNPNQANIFSLTSDMFSHSSIGGPKNGHSSTDSSNESGSGGSFDKVFDVLAPVLLQRFNKPGPVDLLGKLLTSGSFSGLIGGNKNKQQPNSQEQLQQQPQQRVQQQYSPQQLLQQQHSLQQLQHQQRLLLPNPQLQRQQQQIQQLPIQQSNLQQQNLQQTNLQRPQLQQLQLQQQQQQQQGSFAQVLSQLQNNNNNNVQRTGNSLQAQPFVNNASPQGIQNNNWNSGNSFSPGSVNPISSIGGNQNPQSYLGVSGQSNNYGTGGNINQGLQPSQNYGGFHQTTGSQDQFIISSFPLPQQNGSPSNQALGISSPSSGYINPVQVGSVSNQAQGIPNPSSGYTNPIQAGPVSNQAPGISSPSSGYASPVRVGSVSNQGLGISSPPSGYTSPVQVGSISNQALGISNPSSGYASPVRVGSVPNQAYGISSPLSGYTNPVQVSTASSQELAVPSPSSGYANPVQNFYNPVTYGNQGNQHGNQGNQHNQQQEDLLKQQKDQLQILLQLQQQQQQLIKVLQSQQEQLQLLKNQKGNLGQNNQRVQTTTTTAEPLLSAVDIDTLKEILDELQ